MKIKCISTTRLAEICGVSQGTVDRALNDRKGIHPETKQRILAVAKEYGYRPNLHARSMKGGKSMLIGIVVFDLENEYFSELVSGIESALAARGYYSIIMLTHKDKKRELECLENLYRMSADGIVLCPVACGQEFEAFLQSLETPIVTVGNRIGSVPYVGIDNHTAMYETVSDVILRGYQKLIYVMPHLKPEQNSSAQTERHEGFLAAVKEHGVIYKCVEFHSAKEEIIHSENTACICATDLYALRLWEHAQAYRVGIVGFDNLRMINEIGLRLDSVSQDIGATASGVVSVLLDKKMPSAPVRHTLIHRGSLQGYV